MTEKLELAAVIEVAYSSLPIDRLIRFEASSNVAFGVDELLGPPATSA